jgi:hypothetical protein
MLEDTSQPERMPAMAVHVRVGADLASLSLAWPDSLRLVLAATADGAPLVRPALLGNQALAAEAQRVGIGQQVLVAAPIDGPYLRLATVAGIDRWLQAPIRSDLLALDRLLAEMDLDVPAAITASADRVVLGLSDYLEIRAPEAGRVLAEGLLGGLERLRPLTDVTRSRLDTALAQLRDRVESDQTLDRELDAIQTPVRERAITSPVRDSKWDPVDRIQVPARVVRAGLDGRDVHSRLDGNYLSVTAPAIGTRGRLVPSERLSARLVDTDNSRVLTWCELTYDETSESYVGRLSTEGLGTAAMDDRYVVDVFDALADLDPRVDEPDWAARSALSLSQDAYAAYRLAVSDLVVHGTPTESRRRLTAQRATLQSSLEADSAAAELGAVASLIDAFALGLDEPLELREVLSSTVSRPTLAELDLADEGAAA